VYTQTWKLNDNDQRFNSFEPRNAETEIYSNFKFLNFFWTCLKRFISWAYGYYCFILVVMNSWIVGEIDEILLKFCLFMTMSYVVNVVWKQHISSCFAVTTVHHSGKSPLQKHSENLPNFWFSKYLRKTSNLSPLRGVTYSARANCRLLKKNSRKFTFRNKNAAYKSLISPAASRTDSTQGGSPLRKITEIPVFVTKVQHRKTIDPPPLNTSLLLVIKYNIQKLYGVAC